MFMLDNNNNAIVAPTYLRFKANFPNGGLIITTAWAIATYFFGRDEYHSMILASWGVIKVVICPVDDINASSSCVLCVCACRTTLSCHVASSYFNFCRALLPYKCNSSPLLAMKMDLCGITGSFELLVVMICTNSMFASITEFVRCPEWPNVTYEIFSIRDEELRKRLVFEPLDEILDRMPHAYELDGESCKNPRNMTTDCHINYSVLGAFEVREDQVVNWKLCANLILTCCANFNLMLTINLTQLYAAPTVTLQDPITYYDRYTKYNYSTINGYKSIYT